jgi:hypothetical protein
VQTYILVDNGQSPIANVKALADAAICGTCKHRRGKGGSCYVNLGQGPRAVADGVNRGIYPADLAKASELAAGRVVRLGTYGDPAAVPAYVWAELLQHAAGNLGYSHQWADGKADHVMQWCMASADNAMERMEAKARGFRTFRVRHESENTMAGEFVCPASAEAGKRKTCDTCGACSGGVGTRKADPVIVVHGSLKNRFVPIVALI